VLGGDGDDVLALCLAVEVGGIISIGDLVKYVIASQSAAIAHLENYIHGGYTG
jgi:hypothetical protein